jgi:3-hydroxybutyryl-CoA dehydrogenase
MTEGTFTGPLAVIGAGVMGRGIAYAALAGGLETRLVDVDAAQLGEAEQRIFADLAEGVERGKLDRDRAERARGLLRTSTDLESACSGVVLAIEAVVERIDTKHEIFRSVERVAGPGAVIATNTSALSITEIAAALTDPSRAVGMHFFNPVPKMRLCELVRGLETSEETLATAERAAAAMGKTTVRVEDVPGFATSRVNALIGNEGLRMLEEGVARPEDIDTAVKLGLNHPMGPLEMADLVGLDVRLAVLEHLALTLGERFRPTNIHRRLVSAGRLGRKTGRGIYRYDEQGRRVDEPSDLGQGR